MLKLCEKRKQQEINAHSVSTAKLGLMILGAFGQKGAKGRLDDFLPFDREKRENQIEQKTRAAMLWALKNKKMPAAVVGMIGAELNS